MANKIINTLFPQAFGPGSWRGTDEKLARIYASLHTAEEKKLETQAEETSPPPEIEPVEG